MIELFDKVKNFILGEPEEEYEEEYNDNYGEEYENEQEVSNGSNVRSFGSSFGGFTQKMGFGSSSSASKKNAEPHFLYMHLYPYPLTNHSFLMMSKKTYKKTVVQHFS